MHVPASTPPFGVATRSLSPGVNIGGRYRVTAKIAEGAMGEVWAAEHVALKIRVALKVLLRESLGNPEVTARFAREAFLLGQIRSDHVARVLDFIADSAYGPVLVMEFVEGTSLADVLQLRRLRVEEAVDLGIDLATALRELHAAHIVHRDVKPANIILRPLAEGTSAVFVDLGVSRVVAETDVDDDEKLTEITSADRALGTVEYMAPEQILSARNVTAAADLYAVGAILFRAITGKHVFGDLRGPDLLRVRLCGDPPQLDTGRIDPVARGLESVVARALARHPEDRYEVADEMLTDLSLLRDTAKRAARRASRTTMPRITNVEVEPQRSQPPPLPLPPPKKEKSRLPLYAAIVAASLVAGAGAGGMLGFKTGLARSGNVAGSTEKNALAGCSLVAHDQGTEAGKPENRLSFSIVCDK